jgi:hypothetical protein
LLHRELLLSTSLRSVVVVPLPLDPPT